MLRCLDRDQQLAHPIEVDHALGDRVGQDRLGLGAEQHPIGSAVEVERLDAHPVADHHQLAHPAIPDRECVHPVEPLGHRLTPVQISPQYHLGVTEGPKPLPLGDQLITQLGEVVRLTAVDHHHVTLGRRHRHRLSTTGQVDHRQATMTKGRMPIRPHPDRIRTPAGHRLGHRIDRHSLPRQIPTERNPTSNAAHSDTSMFRLFCDVVALEAGVITVRATA